MENDDISLDVNYPSNSFRSKAAKETEEKIKPVAHGQTVRRRRTFKEWLQDLIFEQPEDDHYDFFYEDILRPAALDMVEDISHNILDVVRDAIDTALFGSSRSARRRRSGYYRTSYDDDYDEYWNRERRTRRSRRDRDRDRDERYSRRSDDVAAKVESRSEAIELVKAMQKRIGKFDQVSVLIFYELADMPTKSTDDDYGWDIGHPFDAKITRVRDGYIVEPVPPIYLDR